MRILRRGLIGSAAFMAIAATIGYKAAPRKAAMAMDDATLRAITACNDRAAIENVLGLYCRAIDRLDIELLKSVYHPDGVDDHGAICANAYDFAGRVISVLRATCVYTMHTITHSVIDVRGEQASSESYYLAVHTVAAGEGPIAQFFGETYLDEQRAAGRVDRRHEYLCCGRYLDELHKRDGVWRIFRRKMTNEWGVCRPESTVTEGIPGAFTTTGRRDRQDPVYRLTLA